jgi:hypothetical protein
MLNFLFEGHVWGWGYEWELPKREFCLDVPQTINPMLLPNVVCGMRLEML